MPRVGHPSIFFCWKLEVGDHSDYQLFDFRMYFQAENIRSTGCNSGCISSIIWVWDVVEVLQAYTIYIYAYLYLTSISLV